MKSIKIPTHNETLQKILKAIEEISVPSDRGLLSLTHSELRYLKRLILSDEATMVLMFESLDEHIEFVEKQREE